MSSDNLIPTIIAHRGSNTIAPENTLAAFHLADEHGADGIELDVHLSLDGEVVVIHDSHLERTTNGSGSVYEKTLAELKELDASNRFSGDFAGERIPTLGEVFETIGSRMFVNIELKGPGLFRSQLPQKVVGIVEHYSMQARVIFSSFNPWLLRQTAPLLPDARLGILLPPGWVAGPIRVLSKSVVKPWSYHPHFQSVTNKFFKRAKRENRPVLAYTVDDAEEIARLCRLGIYGIITDDPVKALAVRAETL